MRILFLSNFYPPARSGGYTQWCHEVAERLRARGHTAGVLTSRYERAKAPEDETNVFRWLHLQGDLEYYRPLHFFTAWAKERHENLAVLQDAVDQFRPELIFVWGMWALSHALPALAEERLPGRVIYYLSDYWPMTEDMHTTYWQAPSRRWSMRLPKRALRLVAKKMLAGEKYAAPRFENAICVSHAVKRKLVEAGLPLAGAQVIHGGTDVARFPSQNGRRFRSSHGCVRLLYAGQIVEHKGVHTAIEAMARLAQNNVDRMTAQLTIMGNGHPAYEARLRRMVAEQALHDWVCFRQPVLAAEVPAVFSEHDVLIFPSIYDEPLARVTQEAMASGMVVIGTATGGTPEILNDGINGLTFPAGDSAALARQLRRLMSEPELGRRLAAAGRRSVLTYFNLERMVDEIEIYLQAVTQGFAWHGEAPPARLYH